MNRAIGRDWEDIEREIFTPEEIAEAELKASIISELIKARNERKLSQRDLEKPGGHTKKRAPCEALPSAIFPVMAF